MHRRRRRHPRRRRRHVATAVHDDRDEVPPDHELIRIAGEYDTIIMAGLIEVDGDRFHNTYVTVSRDGYITKFRKLHKGRIRGEAKGGSDLAFGHFGLKATQPERITARQIEAARRAMTRHMKRQGRVWIRIFPDTPISAKPIEVRMGKGKGEPDFWAAVVKPGTILYEIAGVEERHTET